MVTFPSRRILLIRPALVVGLLGLAATVMLTTDTTERAFSQTDRIPGTSAPEKRPRYSEFQHDLPAHKKQCASCHKFPSPNWKSVRPTSDAFPDITDYPDHRSCVGCHRQEFFRGSRPTVCSICHVSAGPRNSRRHPFPNPREIFDASPKGQTATSDFEINFPHSTHVGMVSQVRTGAERFRKASYIRSRAAEESCAVCHKTLTPQGNSDDEYFTRPPADLGEGFWLKKGTFMSVPTGHTTCFTCHSLDSGLAPAPNSCGTCHVLKGKSTAADVDLEFAARMGVTQRILVDAWRTRGSSGTFRHEFTSHAEMECSACHNVEKMNTMSPSTKKVSMSSCAVCHVTSTTDDGGALNFEVDQRMKDRSFQCTKCHVMFGKMPIPESHLNAIKEAMGN